MLHPVLRRLMLVPVLCLLSPVLVIAQEPKSVDAPSSSKFLKYVDDGKGGGSLQASVVRYINDDGVVVDLVAAIHIADGSYFKALDESFDDYDAVLYEMVAPAEMLAPTTQGSDLRALRRPGNGAATRPARAPRRGGGLAFVGGMQRFLKDRLKLTFQMEQINYERPHFIHADMDAETFLRLQSERGEGFLQMFFNAMLRGMARGSGSASGSGPPPNQPSVAELVAALQSPDQARTLKLMFAQQFAHLDVQMEMLEGPNGSVILSERNKAAMNVLKQTIPTGKKNIAIFYGAAHLKGMEEILTNEMGFTQVGPPFWRVAWDMSAPPQSTTRPTTRRSR